MRRSGLGLPRDVPSVYSQPMDNNEKNTLVPGATNPNTRCGYVVIMGPPNAGKSTLLNSILGVKVSIVSHKVQTTRTRISGIFTKDETQIVFVDTPGIFISKAKNRLETSMLAAAWHSVFDADQVLLMIDASKNSFREEIQMIIKTFQKQNRKVMVALNKIDLIAKEKLLEHAKSWMATGVVEDVFMISARKKQGIEGLLEALIAKMPRAPFLYPEDQLADVPMKFLASELTREQIFHQVHHEIPYNITVRTETWERFRNKSLKIVQMIYVKNPLHRSIILGKNGEMIKRIGMNARLEIEHLLACPVHLMLHVTVDPNWQERPEHYTDQGLEFSPKVD